MTSGAEASNAPQAKDSEQEGIPAEEAQTEVRKFATILLIGALPLNADTRNGAQNFLEIAQERKQEGTEYFRKAKWNEALVAYQAALNILPKRPQSKPAKAPSIHQPEEEEENDVATATESTTSKDKRKVVEEEVIDVSSPAVSEADREIVRLRTVLNANIGACFVKLGDHKEVVQACSQAILDDPTYVKALERRAASNEIINSWTSLAAAQEDYNTLLNLVSPAQVAGIRRKLQYLKPRLEAAQKKETDEMLGKLKGLGNSILGNFGLSTDNFKFEPNGAGGYSMNFSR